MQDKNKAAQIKQTTIQKIDNYTKLKTFKELSKDKQKAILYLKEINPAPMPEGVSKENLENLFRHFENKQDENARRYYSKLFDDTKQHADFILDTKGKEGQARKEYIKAYQHKSTQINTRFILHDSNRK